MPTGIGRDEVRRLLAQGAQLIEVLPREEFEEQHLAGAMSLPLEELDAPSAGRLDRARPVVCYCDDFQ